MEKDDPYTLSRFIAAQAPVFDTVLSELRAGRKRTHWMWFVFPQLRALGKSATANFYGVGSLDEARAYLQNPILADRLAQAVSAVPERSAYEIFGSPDDLKFRSSMTLFHEASDGSATLFKTALERFFDGEPDKRTLELIR